MLRILSDLISKLNQNQICANNCNLSSGPNLMTVLRYRITILGTKSLTSIHLPLLFAFFNELCEEERSIGKNTWPFFFPSETLINKVSRQKATTDILMAHGFSAVCAHDVFEQFFRWTLIASVDPSVKTQRDAL